MHSIRHIACAMFLGLLVTTFARAEDWPQWLGPKRDGIWRESGILDKFPTAGRAIAELDWNPRYGVTKIVSEAFEYMKLLPRSDFARLAEARQRLQSQ